MRLSRGFTLLEVMVAVAILGLGLTAILSAQFGSVKGVSHARGLSVAIGQARCKMSEIEEHLRREGFKELEERDSGACCGDGIPGFWCEWRIEKPRFPDADAKLNLDAKLDSQKLGALGKLATDGAKPGGAPVDPSAGLSGITDALGPAAEELASGGVGGIASTVMTMVYPSLKRVFETSSRRITLVVHWDEAGRDYHFDLIQWVTNPQPSVGTSSDDLSATGTPSTASTSGTTGGTR
jgi:general secretion pathway protein I